MNFTYIGCRTTKERGACGKGISVCRPRTDGSWELVQLAETVNPSFLCMDREEQYLYAIHGDYSQISAYRSEKDGTLTELNTVSTYGTNPVHLCVDKSNRWVFVANLQTGSVAVLPRLAGGRLGNIHTIYFLDGNGGPGYISHPHQVMQDRAGNYLVVSAQGRLQGVGKVTVFRIDSENGTLTETCRVAARPGAEPRHCVFSADNRFCFGVNEKDYTVTAYRFDSEAGILTPLQVISTLPQDCVEGGWASGIDITPDGKHLYVSDRKRDVISCFAIDITTGWLTLSGLVHAGGRQPRFIGVSRDGRELIVAHELSNSVSAFPIDPVTGALGEGKVRFETGSPVCVLA